jgi:GPI mannosyltransferase 3
VAALGTACGRRGLGADLPGTRGSETDARTLARLAGELRADPELCGLALYITYFTYLPGREQLVGGSPLYALHPMDPIVEGHLPALAKKHAPAFNRILAPLDSASDLPADFSRRSCATMIDGGVACIFARGGGCDAAAAGRFAINDVLVRLNR